jgi:hypothetical protein
MLAPGDDHRRVPRENDEDLLLVALGLVVLGYPVARGISTRFIPKDFRASERRTSDQRPVRSRSSRCLTVKPDPSVTAPFIATRSRLRRGSRS